MIKAKAQIDLSVLVDVKATYRFYLLQSSTLAKPSKPTSYPPPSTWDDTEPSYTEGSTQSLYFTDCTVFCDDTFQYSEVSLSSAYEAAKVAYNKAVNAQNSANTAYDKAISKGEQLVVNGNGQLGNNTNFSQWTFDGAVANNSPGSFTLPVGSSPWAPATDEFIPINPDKEYTLKFDAKSTYGEAILYSFVDLYDVDKNRITSSECIYVAGSKTKLTHDMVSGGQYVIVEDLSGFVKQQYKQRLMLWNYTNSFGYTYPAETYSRNNTVEISYTGDRIIADDAFDYENNTITLRYPYEGQTVPAGTELSQGGDGASYQYIGAVYSTVPTTWQTFTGKIKGVDYSGNNISGKFPPGTAYAKIGFLWNYNQSPDQIWITNVTLHDTTETTDAQNTANSAQNTANSAYNTANTANNKIDSLDVGGENLASGTFGEWKDITAGAWGASLTHEVNGENSHIFTPADYGIKTGEYITFAVDLKPSDRVLFMQVNRNDTATGSVRYASGQKFYPGETGRSVLTFQVDSSDGTLGAFIGSDGSASSSATQQYKCFKVEKGNKATAWCRSTADVDESIKNAQDTADGAQKEVTEALAQIQIVAEGLQYLVTDENGGSMMTQTTDGWTFNVGTLQKDVNDTMNSLDTLQNTVGDTQNTVDLLSKAVDELGELKEYIKIGTYTYTDEDGNEQTEPSIDLGEADTGFRLKITNTRIWFTDGSTDLVSINSKNKTLEIEKAAIKELKVGGFVWQQRANGNLGLIWKGADE